MSPSYSALFSHWGLDPAFTFLNHGSFGATPIRVLEKQTAIRKRMESQPVRFFIREMEPLWDEARSATAAFLGAASENMVFVKNTTMGVNTVVRNIPLKKGDEVIFHSHIYGACFNTWKQYSEKKGFSIRAIPTPWPDVTPEKIIAALEQSISEQTRILFIDHITSGTGIIYPAAEITRRFKARGIKVFIDGAHAPGMLDLNIEALGCDYYVGNAHKWICSPKGSAILWVHPSHHDEVKPLQWSHVYDRDHSWAKQFFWPGTDDYSAPLCIPEAIQCMGNLFPGGWEELRRQNRALTLKARRHIAKILDLPLPSADEMIGHLATIPLAKTNLPEFGFNFVHKIQEELYHSYKIEVPVFVFPKDDPFAQVRISAQAYNDMSQYEYLAEALKKILRK